MSICSHPFVSHNLRPNMPTVLLCIAIVWSCKSSCSSHSDDLSSVRSQDPNQRRVLDSATRQRRLTRQLEALEKDNFQDDPHASLPQLVKRLPQFDESNESGNESSRCYASVPIFLLALNPSLRTVTDADCCDVCVVLTWCIFIFQGKRRKKTRGDHFKQRFRKNFQALLEEEVTHATHSNCVLRNIQRETLTLFLGECHKTSKKEKKASIVKCMYTM